MSNGTIAPVLEINVIPNSDQDPSLLEFTWELIEMGKNLIKFQLTFEQAVYVSSAYGPDIIQVIFRDRYMFVGTNDLAISLQESHSP